MNLHGRPLPRCLTERVLSKLGFPEPPPPDLDGLTALYRAWCMRVPFDNTRKTMALRAGTGGALPGIDAEDFFEHWLAHGTGGTCWPSSNAMFSILRSAGFDARRVIASMRDLGSPNHASVKVHVAGLDWLADSSMLLNRPLPLGPGVFIGHDPVWPAEVEASGGTHVVWWHTPPGEEHLPCRILVDPATFEEYFDGYDRSRARSPFNERLYARRNRPAALVILIGRTRYRRTSGGVEARELTAGEVQESLREDIGLSGQLIGRWVESGGLAGAAPPQPAPPPGQRQGVPPSRRQPAG
jgi:N-hydroxyarylamine O-acetyltransferase